MKKTTRISALTMAVIMGVGLCGCGTTEQKPQKTEYKTEETKKPKADATKKIINETGVNPDTRVKDLSESDVAKLREYIEHNLRVEGDLRSEVSLSIKRLIEIGCYRGVRHRKNLPVRGQSSKRNARTRKGPRRTVAKKKTASR